MPATTVDALITNWNRRTTNEAMLNMEIQQLKDAATAAPQPLRPMHSAPKDTQILIDTGLGFLQAGHWNAHERCWVYAELNCNDSEGADIYFENSYEHAPRGWLPLPELATETRARETQAAAE